MSHQQPTAGSRGHRPGLSTASVSRMPSYGSQSAAGGSSKAAPSASGSQHAQDRVSSLEQSVRKFRIVEALRNGDTAFISKAVRESGSAGGPRASTSSVNTTTGALEDTTILHLAAQCADLAVVEYVLQESAGSVDINARDRDGNTALHIAAGGGRANVVRLLLDQKDINDSVANYQGRLPIDVARNPEIFQMLQLSRSVFAENKIRQVQDLVMRQDYKTLEAVLDEPRLKTVLDINSPEFASEPQTVQSGGTLLHEAARRRNTQLIQVLLLHGADPFRRDRKGKLPQDVTKDDVTRAMLKRSPAAVAAQRGIQEKAVLGHAASQGMAAAAPGDPLAGREAREMKGYLKKWTNYRKGYQLRWFVLEDGVLSYYKHQDDAGSACRGAINMRIAQLHMSAEEKTKFEIIGKSSVKYTLKANHEVEAKRWFWALNNSIQWTKDQAKEEERQQARNAEMLRQAKADHAQRTPELSIHEANSESASVSEHGRRGSTQLSRLQSSTRTHAAAGPSTTGSVDEDFGGATPENDMSKAGTANGGPPTMAGDAEEHDDDDYGEDSSVRDAGPAGASSKDAFNITAQSTKLQLDTIAQVNAALLQEAARNPSLTLADPKTMQALQTYDAAIRSLTGLVGDLLRIARDRDAHWQYRLDREVDMRRMWEESMAQVAREQELLEARVGEAEEKRRLAKRALREVIETTLVEDQQQKQQQKQQHEEGKQRPSSVGSDGAPDENVAHEKSAASASTAAPVGKVASAGTAAAATDKVTPLSQKSPTIGISRRQTALSHAAIISDSESDEEEEFFDAVDAGEVEVAPMPPSEMADVEKQVVVSGIDISSSFHGYENGIRTKLKIDADNRPKMSLWVSGGRGSAQLSCIARVVGTSKC